MSFQVKIYEEERVSDKAEIKRLKLEKADIDKDKQKDVVCVRVKGKEGRGFTLKLDLEK